jgi:hypothetical protein
MNCGCGLDFLYFEQGWIASPFEYDNEISSSINVCQFLDKLEHCWLVKKNCTYSRS